MVVEGRTIMLYHSTNIISSEMWRINKNDTAENTKTFALLQAGISCGLVGIRV